MSNGRKFVIIALLYIFNVKLRTLGQAISEFKGMWSSCVPQGAFTNCDSSRDNPKILHNTLEYPIEIQLQKGCTTSGLYNYWSLIHTDSGAIINRYPGRREKSTILISKYQLEPGDYVLKAHIRESPILNVDVWIEKQCYLRVTSPCPIPIISGGPYKTAPLGSEIPLIASLTHTCDLDVEYTWYCYSTNDQALCKALNGMTGEITRFQVQGQIGDTYTITLTAKIPQFPARSFLQVINVTASQYPIVDIGCMKNCPPTGSVYSDPKVSIFLKARCFKKCQLIEKYEWILKALTSTTHTPEQIMQNGTYTGTNSEHFILKPNWLGFEEMFEIHLHAYGKDRELLAEAMVHINTTTNVGGQSNCTWKDNGEVALKRMYTIKCAVPSHLRPVKYKLQQIIHDPLTGEPLPRLLTYSDEPIFNVRLGSSGNSTTQTLIFVVVDDTMIMTNTTFEVEVPHPFEESLAIDKLILRMKHAYFGAEGTESVRYLFRIGRISEASQIMNVLLCVAAKLNMTDPGIPVLRIMSQKMLLLDLAASGDFLLSDMEYLLALIPQLVVAKAKHLYHSKLRVRLCLYIARSICKALSLERYPLTYQNYLELMTTPLYKCANYYLDDDYEKPFMFNISLPGPIPEHIALQEDYPNYGELPDAFTIEDLKEIIKKSILTINEASEVYANTFVYGEPDAHRNYTANVTIDITYAEERNRPSYDDGQIEVSLPNSLGPEPKETIRIVYTSLPMKAFFWDTESGNISDHIINLRIYGPRHHEVENLEDKLHVNLKFNAKQRIVERETNLEFPLEDAKWTDEFVQKHMKLFRVEVHSTHSLMSTVSGVKEVKSMMVAITKNRKPIRKDFVIEVRQSDRKSYIFNRSETDTWYYVGFLPREEEIRKLIVKKKSFEPDYGIEFNDDYTVSLNKFDPEKLNITFKYGFTSLTCKEWSGEMWEVSHCDVAPDGDDKRMHCVCSEISTLAGDVKSVTVREKQPLIIPFKISIVVNPIIPLATVIIVALYCILICFAYVRDKPMRLYFLCDNLEEDRYAYLLIVQTGEYQDCSTTSNIMIKLLAKNIDSKAHVLNYPDPNLQILQDGREDWFILTTRYHLGDIRGVQVWYDGIGPKHTWYCEYIKVFDLQSKRCWFFNVSQRFTVGKKDMHNFKFYPSNEEEWLPRRKIYTYLRFYWNADHLWVFWIQGSEKMLTYFERVTVILCKIIFTLAYMMGVLTRPMLKLKDGLGENVINSLEYMFWHTFTSAIICFLIFSPFTIILRYTHKNNCSLKHEKTLLGHRVRSASWIFLVFVATACTACLISFGFWVSYISSVTVLTITFLSICMNGILLENMKIVVLKYVTSQYLTKFSKRHYTINLKAVIAEAERQRRYIFGKLGRFALRPYLTHLYRPLTQKKFLKIKAESTRKYNIEYSASKMAFFYLYTSMLFFLLFVNLNPLSYVNSKHMLDLALYGGNRKRAHDYEIDTFEDLYDYLNDTLASVVHPMSWYGDWNVSESGLLDDYNTKILGVVRIRQKRVLEMPCLMPTFTRMINMTTCYPEYDRSYADKSDRGLSKSMWSFQDVEFHNVKLGHLHTYDGTGFIMKLGRNLNNTYYIIQLMKSNNWFDKRTRAVFVEFWTYNVNQNLFSAITILFERSATQTILVSRDILSLELMHNSVAISNLSTAIFVVFCILIFRLCLGFIREVIKHRLRSLLAIANIWEVIIIVTNVTIVVLYIKQHRNHIRVFREFCDAKHNEFISYFSVMNNYFRIQTATSVLFAFAIAHGITFMKFIEAFRVFQKTLTYAYKSYLAICLYASVVVIMFGCSGHIMFGGWSNTFRNLEISVVALLKRAAALTSEFSGKTQQDYNKNIGYLFYFLFSFCILFTMNVFISTTMLYYRKSRLDLLELEYHYSLGEFVTDKWRYYSELWRRNLVQYRLKAGQDTVEMPKIAIPKRNYSGLYDYHVVADMKLLHMTYVVRAVVMKLFFKREDPPDTAEFELMRNLAVTCFWEQDEGFGARSKFFVTKTADGKVKFVSNKTLMHMEYCLNNILAIKDGMKLNLTDVTSLKQLEQLENSLNIVNNILGNISVKTVKRRKM